MQNAKNIALNKRPNHTRFNTSATCSMCKFDFPVSKHLGRCDTCNFSNSCGSLSLSSNMHQRDVMICKSCSKDNNNKQICIICHKGVLHWSQDYVPYDKVTIGMLGQFRMVIPCLLYVIGLPKKYGQEQIIRSQKFFG
jgi:hypothetical protein